MSDTKQIALALYLYVQDYDETTPGGCFANFGCNIDENGQKKATNFTALWPLRPSVKNDQVFLCPSVVGWNRPDARPQKGSYASNRTAVEDSNPLASIDEPARSVGYVDSFLPWLNDVAGYYAQCRFGHTMFCWDDAANGCKPSTCSNRRIDWHNEGVNAIYLDGHARWRKLSQFTYSEFLAGPQFGLSRTDKRCNCPITVWPKSCDNPAQ